ncbi:MAG: NAD-dependent protein deacylase [Tenericutes bacterium]|nr:NAD-dependent protein deacylase [Mycoplasmatota bacterium]
MEKVKEVKRIKEIIEKANYIVFLGGAGVSTESGVPDFRSARGIYNQQNELNPEKILSHNFFMNQPKIFYDYYKEKIVNVEALPNQGHIYLTKLEKSGKLKAIITQNIDGLHKEADSKNVIELHGSIFHNHCVKCNKYFDLDYIRSHDGTIRCDSCNGLVKPDVVLYGENLDDNLVEAAITHIIKSDLLIVAGTSLNVYPAAGLLRYAKKKLLINLTRTSKDIFCDYVYYGKFGETCEQLMLD